MAKVYTKLLYKGVLRLTLIENQEVASTHFKGGQSDIPSIPESFLSKVSNHPYWQ